MIFYPDLDIDVILKKTSSEEKSSILKINLVDNVLTFFGSYLIEIYPIEITFNGIIPDTISYLTFKNKKNYFNIYFFLDDYNVFLYSNNNHYQIKKHLKFQKEILKFRVIVF
ncbi:MAG: hypothetical protein RMJ67_01335 [Elusimicrobiota bacterium]|nr:hypothetical protein [Endomicrobiia bacterium]MDW8165147.1 hypothetical protein [Elusimicrobiota bacterium]